MSRPEIAADRRPRGARLAAAVVLLLAAASAARADTWAALATDAAELAADVARIEPSLGDGLATHDLRVRPEGAWPTVAMRGVAFEAPLGEADRAAAVHSLARQMEEAGLRVFVARRRSEALTWAMPFGPREAMAELPVPVIGVAATVAQRTLRGSELKAIVHEDGGPSYAVAARHDLDAAIEVSFESWAGPSDPPDVPSASFGARFGGVVVADGDRAWTARERGLLALALGHVPARERRVLPGVRFVRSVRADGADPDQAGRYTLGPDGPVIELFDIAFAAEDESFVGPADAPLPQVLRVVLHEVGHAIAMHPAARARERFHAAVRRFDRLHGRLEHLSASAATPRLRRRAVRSLRDARDQLELARPAVREASGRSVVLRAYADTTGGYGPTAYGRTTVSEAFAEAYALYRLDREALERAEPAAVGFFDAGLHLPPEPNDPQEPREMP